MELGKQFGRAATAAVIAIAASAPCMAQTPSHLPSWTAAVDSALGRHGAMQPGDVYKFSFPRSDMRVMVDEVRLKPSFALGSWIAFKPMNNGSAMVMGDLVLAESEIGVVMRTLQDGGVDQTALHNHILMESPRVMYVHISTTGNAARIAQTLARALSLTKTPLGVPSTPTPGLPIDLDTAAIAHALGYTGKVNGGVYQVSISRRETIREHGETVPPAMGVATGLNFQPIGNGRAAITGDFVLLGTEVNPVIRALRGHGILVTAVHNHMLTESPRLFFMHFWASGDAATLARGLRSAIDETSSRTQ